MSSSQPTEKQIKAALKEGGKKGQDLAGMSAMGGVRFFSVAVESAHGSMELMDKILEGMNKNVDETADDRKGGAGDIGKTLLYADERVLLIVSHVPVERRADINHKEWFDAIVNSVGADIISKEGEENVLRARMAADPSKNKYPLKVRDTAINSSFEYLVSKQLVRPDDDDDDENYAEMANIEW